MSGNFLPNTKLATIVQSEDAIFTYAQSYYGQILEVQGKLVGTPKIYTRTGDVKTVSTTDLELTAKKFTPLAAVFTRDWKTSTDRRYVFYLDDSNRLCDAYYDTNWHKGSLSDQNWVAAHYSSLAAIQQTPTVGANFVDANSISLYYQNTSESGDIVEVSYSRGRWTVGPPPINDPPLFGTSLSVVAPEAGIQSKVSTNNMAPVVFFQYDRLGLGSSQDLGGDDYNAYHIPQHDSALSAHTSIAAVDDGINCYVFYTSDDNNVQRVRVDSTGLVCSTTVVPLSPRATPRSSLSAVMFSDTAKETVVLFHLQHWTPDLKTTESHHIYATTLNRESTATASVDIWDVSTMVRITRG
ncbi:hypothetical protein F5B18DRAFT_618030 [Nemania serpens]|nr:hypothetical protein F5B18DRAFT_618030 [Nemania serpens]